MNTLKKIAHKNSVKQEDLVNCHATSQKVIFLNQQAF